MADDTIIVNTNGVNEVTIGASSKLSMVKPGESKSLKVATTPSDSKPVKWVWIATEFLDEAKKMQPEQVYDKWGEWKSKNAQKPVDKFGIGKQYVLANKTRIKTSKKDLTEGRIYYFEPFFDFPTLDNGHYIATVDKPKILSAYFAQHKDQFKYPGEDGASDVYTYKGNIRLYITAHMIPDYTVNYHNFALFEVDIYDKEGDKKITDKPLRFFQKTRPGTFSVNTITELDIIIDEAWRDKSHHKKDTVKTYYAKINTTIYSNKDASANETAKKYPKNTIVSYNPHAPNGNKFRAVAPNKDITAVVIEEEDYESTRNFFGGYDAERAKNTANQYSKTKIEEYNITKGTVIKGQEVVFKVKYNTMDVILDNYEANKSNMLAVVGDIAYSSMNGAPCKYSKLEIRHKSRKDPFVIFDENKTTNTVVDHTKLTFAIVAGDKKETITVTAAGLAIQSYQDKGLDKPKCYGITMAKKIRKSGVVAKRVKHRNEDGFIHYKIGDVFNMQQAYILFPERIDNINAQAIETRGRETLNITSQSIEHTYKGNSIELKLGYLYDKNYDNRVLNFLAYDTGYLKGPRFQEALKNIWVVRYLYRIAKGEPIHQSYFVPVGTCRYPNQLVRIAVYPDMKWVINLNYNIKEPLYYNETPTQMEYHKLSGAHDMSGNIARKREAATAKQIATAYQNQKSGFGLYVECEVDGSSKIKLGKDFAEKFRKMMAPLTWIVDKLDNDLGVSNAKEEQEKLKLTGKKGLLARLNKLPMSFELTAPNIGVGIGIGYGETQGHEVGYELEGRILMNPIIGANVKLDVLALGSKLKPWGAIIDALDIAAWLLEFCSRGKVDLEYQIFVKFTAEILLVGAGSKDGSNKPAELTYNFASKKYAGNIALQGRLKGEITFKFGIKLKAKVEIVKGKVPVENNEKMYEVAGAGIEAGADSEVALTLGKNFGETDNFTSDFYFSGVTVFIKLRGGRKKKKKPSTLDIIPDFEKSFDVLKNKGEYK